MTIKILCVCIGNSDRSPVMAAVLGMYLSNARHEVSCESVGISEHATKGGCATKFAVEAAKRIGLDISNHRKRHINAVNLADYDLIICANEVIAEKIIEAGADMTKVYNAQITNPWPCQFQEDYDTTFMQILSGMYRVVARYFPNPKLA